MSGDVVIRPSRPEHDRVARAEVVRKTWEFAYSDIFSPAEIRQIFDGSLPMSGDWTRRRSAPAATLVAEEHGRLVGVAGLGLMEAAVGELAALYVLPEHQGRGLGLGLWEAATAELRRLGCARMEVWTLARADARHFYEARGCRLLGEGVLRVGGHSEAVLGYGLPLTEQAPVASSDR